MVNLENCKDCVENTIKNIDLSSEYLTELDIAIGDGDHGVNMKKGFNSINIETIKNATDFSELFSSIAISLMSNIGGASGPIYGTLFLEYSKVTKGVVEIDTAKLVEMNNAAILGIKKIGGAEFGEKTLLDALISFNNALSLDEKNIADSLKLLDIAVEKTKEYIAKKGRAAYLGEKSIGHIDPGCASLQIVMRGLFE